MCAQTGHFLASMNTRLFDCSSGAYAFTSKVTKNLFVLVPFFGDKKNFLRFENSASDFWLLFFSLLFLPSKPILRG